jgi:hypothetical protein
MKDLQNHNWSKSCHLCLTEFFFLLNNVQEFVPIVKK